MTTALVLGGAPSPTLLLQCGALAALDANNVKIDVISSSGSGTLVALLYAAPKAMTREAALYFPVNFFISDDLYYHFPFNFKLYWYPGAQAKVFRSFLRQLPLPNLPDTPLNRLMNDLFVFGFNAFNFALSDLSQKSAAISDPAPWLEDIIDLSRLPTVKSDIYVAAYSLDASTFTLFKKDEINFDHIRAALAYPFQYTPSAVNGADYIDASILNIFCFLPLLDLMSSQNRLSPADKQVTTLITSAALPLNKLIRAPRNLQDAWNQSINIPLASRYRKEIRLFEDVYLKNYQEQLHLPERDRLAFLTIPVDRYIPDEHWPYVLDWSYSNATKLYEVGYQAGAAFCDEHRAVLESDALPTG